MASRALGLFWVLGLLIGAGCGSHENGPARPGGEAGSAGTSAGTSSGGTRATAGTSSGGSRVTGGTSGRSGTGGAYTGGSSTGGASTGGAHAGGTDTGGASTGGRGSNAGGSSTGGAHTGGSSTGGASTGGSNGGSAGGSNGGSAGAGFGGGDGGVGDAGSGATGGNGTAGADTGGSGGTGGNATGGNATGGYGTGGEDTGGSGGTGGGGTGGISVEDCLADALAAETQTEMLVFSADGVSVGLVRFEDGMGTSGTTVWSPDRFAIEFAQGAECVAEAGSLDYQVLYHNFDDSLTATGENAAYLFRQQRVGYETDATFSVQVDTATPIALELVSCTELRTGNDCSARYSAP